MWSLSILTTLLAISHISLANKHTTKPCPTVTSTGTICSTCIRPDCIILETISAQRHCPSKVPTVTKSFPCSKSKCPGGCATSYAYASSYGPSKTKPVCPTATTTKSVCSTCIRPACVMLSTLSSVCGCPKTAATITTSYPCGKGCPAGCGTDFVEPTVTPNCRKGKGSD